MILSKKLTPRDLEVLRSLKRRPEWTGGQKDVTPTAQESEVLNAGIDKGVLRYADIPGKYKPTDEEVVDLSSGVRVIYSVGRVDGSLRRHASASRRSGSFREKWAQECFEALGFDGAGFQNPDNGVWHVIAWEDDA